MRLNSRLSCRNRICAGNSRDLFVASTFEGFGTSRSPLLETQVLATARGHGPVRLQLQGVAVLERPAPGGTGARRDRARARARLHRLAKPPESRRIYGYLWIRKAPCVWESGLGERVLYRGLRGCKSRERECVRWRSRVVWRASRVDLKRLCAFVNSFESPKIWDFWKRKTASYTCELGATGATRARSSTHSSARWTASSRASRRTTCPWTAARCATRALSRRPKVC